MKCEMMAILILKPKTELSGMQSVLFAVAEVGHFEWRGKHDGFSESFFRLAK